MAEQLAAMFVRVPYIVQCGEFPQLQGLLCIAVCLVLRSTAASRARELHLLHPVVALVPYHIYSDAEGSRLVSLPCVSLERVAVIVHGNISVAFSSFLHFLYKMAMQGVACCKHLNRVSRRSCCNFSITPLSVQFITNILQK